MRNSTIEIIATSYMVQNKTVDILERNGFTHEDFSGDSREIVKYIQTHLKEYGVVPDESTVIYEFGDKYSRTIVEESPLYIEDTLRTHITYNKLSKFLETNQSQLTGSPKDFDDAVADMVEMLEKEQARKKSRTLGTDLTKAKSRVDEYAKRMQGEGEDALDLGIPTIDEALGGVLADDLVVIYARQSVGKSYMMTYIASNLHKQGLNVLFYSGEMEESQVGYRFDSMRAHVSNRALLSGMPFPEDSANFTQYTKYLEELEKVDNYFTVVHPKEDFNGEQPTVKDIERLIDQLQPDVVFIDQLSLMRDHNRARDAREKTTNIIRDLRTMAAVRRIPTFVAVQANRQAAIKDAEGEFEIPEVHHLAESDAVGQFATRAIGLSSKRTDDKNIQILNMGIKKNRHGFLTDVKLTVDFDKGYVEEQVDNDMYDMTVTEEEVPF